ncbi:hypothetical protein PHYPSEUDO_009510 [Phytophthora pseudosyringae]|uniref:Uncharacterized protein n=1 Tax=Phytophthora pseudosyringae TaxID=221518 RepID=A0A8T1VH64_9STRA|nr:hypothetical protein PHYPSEUDO_009510 [Phytophthora pseudosyringae]
MSSRSGAGPPPPGQGPGRYIPSPRRQAAVRLPTSVPATGVPTGPRRGSGLNYPSAAMLAAAVASAGPEDINPKIAEIQARVEELVRRYDDDVAAVDHEQLQEEEDDSFGDKAAGAPARWRVGDVLLATHRAMARTSTHTERSIMAEFADDLEVSAAIGSGAQQMGDAFIEAEELTARRHQRLSHIHQALQSVAANGMSLDASDDEEEDDQTAAYAIRERQLKSTIDALHREKDSMTVQLQEALRAQQESRLATEQQTQELVKAQRALRAQSEELRHAQDNNEKAVESANALMASWRDKFQASAKAAAAAEARVQELETKVRAQSEEIMKHTFVLQAKMQEMERFKESEAARSRAEAAAQGAALAEAEAEASRAKAKALEVKRKTKLSVDGSIKELQEMEDKVRELEGTLLAAENAKLELEAENAELERRMRDLQARFGEQRKFKASSTEKQPETDSVPASTFALRLRENTPRANTRTRQRGGATKPSGKPSSPAVSVTSATIDDAHDLSSSESEAGESDDDGEVDEVERDERELNRVMQQVVATVFPVVSPADSDETLDESIAQYEDPTRSPLNEIQPSPVDAASVVSSTGDAVPRSELDALRSMFEREVDALKQQYVDGLLEYKRLVIEQYGRRQVIERERHRLEIEGLLRLTQTKFHAELSRRSGRLKRAKESLKVLYNALHRHSGPAMGPEDQDEDLTQPFNSVTPLKTLLRAAILAMSTSATRNGRGRTQIEQLAKLLPSPDTRTRAVAAAMTIHTAIGEDKPRRTVETQDVSSQTDVLPTLLRERKTEVAPMELRAAPESVDGYVLPGSPCFKARSKVQHDPLVAMLHLVVGIPVSAALIAELRRLLPNLPPGNYYVSTALRLALFHELVRFFAAVDAQAEAMIKTRPSPRAIEGEDQLQDADVAIGSPRDTPFLRRKALETVESRTRQRNRRQLFASGGVAILQAAPFTSSSH